MVHYSPALPTNWNVPAILALISENMPLDAHTDIYFLSEHFTVLRIAPRALHFFAADLPRN